MFVIHKQRNERGALYIEIGCRIQVNTTTGSLTELVRTLAVFTLLSTHNVMETSCVAP